MYMHIYTVHSLYRDMLYIYGDMLYMLYVIGCGPQPAAPATATGRSRRVRNNCGAHIHGLLAPPAPSPQPILCKRNGLLVRRSRPT